MLLTKEPQPSIFPQKSVVSLKLPNFAIFQLNTIRQNPQFYSCLFTVLEFEISAECTVPGTEYQQTM